MFGFLDVPVAGAFHLIDPLITLLSPVLGGAAIAVAVILFTCAVRLLLHPLARAAMRGELARAALAPKIAELRDRHKNNPSRLQAEMMKLQQESGLSLFAGCLPMFIQLPFFSIMYRLCTSATVHGHANSLLAGTIFGVPAGKHLLAGGLSPIAFVVFAVLLGLLATSATFAMRWQPAPPSPTPAANLMRYLAYFPVLIAMFLPLAGGIYLLTSSTWTAVERRLLRRSPALVPGETRQVESAGGGN